MIYAFRKAALLAPLGLALSLAACGGDSSSTPPSVAVNTAPSFLGTIAVKTYDGTSDDLLTAGLGWNGLQGAAPTVSATPTAAELRKLAIYTNYRALVDITSNGGYGTLYGPNVTVAGVVDATAGAGKIAGTEYIAYSLGSGGKPSATLMVQIPSNFDTTAPCIVTATSSGSRGVYGAVSAAGEWGLKRRCAVAYSDKGSGNGGEELATNTITLIDGTLANANTAGNLSQFTANLSASELSAFNNTHPNRYAYKHAHSQANPEKDWGTFTLQAIQFALWAMNEQFAPLAPGTTSHTVQFVGANTLVIAASVSNGGGAAIAAAEQDTSGLIDAVVVGEPQINPRLPAAGITVARGGVNYPTAAIGRPLFDYTSLANLLQPCAAYAPGLSAAPLFSVLNQTAAQNRCAALAANGWITGADFTSQSTDALNKLHLAGWEPEGDLLHYSHYFLQASPAVAVTYANAYARARVDVPLCGYSFATTNVGGMPAAPTVSPLLTSFGLGNGVPPTNGINLIYENAVGGPINHLLADNNFAFLAAQCLRQLWTTSSTDALAVQAGVDQVKVGGNLRGKPTIIVQGRSDALVPVNNGSRPYLGLNKLVEGAGSKLSYIEITNGQHFDSFLGTAGFDTRYIPVHYYNIQALNMMWNTMRAGAALPPSQVVRTTPRGGTPGAAPALSVAANLPPISLAPVAGNLITIDNANAVQIPN